MFVRTPGDVIDRERERELACVRLGYGTNRGWSAGGGPVVLAPVDLPCPGSPLRSMLPKEGMCEGRDE